MSDVLNDLLFNKGICINILDNGTLITYNNNMNKSCVPSSDVEVYKNELEKNNNKDIIFESTSKKYGVKSMVYAFAVDSDTYYFLTTSINPIDSTVTILKNQFLTVSIVILLLSFVVGFFISQKLSKPIIALSKSAKKVAKGDYKEEFKSDSNISEIQELTTSLNYAKDELSKTNELRRELLANVSHDLKTPLTGIKNYVELLNDPSISEEDKKSYLERLNQYTDRLSILITDLFEVSKANSGNIDLEYSDINIIEFMEQVCAENEELLQAKNLQLVTNLPEKEIHVCLDGNKTYRIFENLFTNISKDALENTRVFLDVKDIGNSVMIIMKNTSKEPLDFDSDITERFVRGDKSRHEAGSGLGLAIVKSFTEVQNGTFMIETDGDLFKSILSFHKS